MLKSYLTTGWRNTRRNAGIAAINVAGLSIGMAATIMIFLWFNGELHVDTTFENYNRIGKVYHHLKFGGDVVTHDGTSYPYGNAIKTQFPDFEEVAMTTNVNDHLVELGAVKFVRKGFFVDPAFLSIFSITPKGNNVFKNIRSMLLSRSLASAMFGNDPVGKTIRLDSKDEIEVTGVFNDFPKGSAFDGVDMMLPMSYYGSMDEGSKYALNNQNDVNFNCYVLMSDERAFNKITDKIKDFAKKTAGEDIRALDPKGFVFPMAKWHLYNDFKNGENTGTAVQRLWMLGTAALLILGLAIINFVNLSTARAAKRAREVGVRKIMGSLRTQLVRQFTTESLIVVAAAFSVSISLVYLLMPSFNQLTDSNIALRLTWEIVGGIVCILLLTAVLASAYPAFYLSSLTVVDALKGASKAGGAQGIFRKALVVIQFSICCSILICTGVVYSQIQHSKNRPVGFDRKGIAYLEIRTPSLHKANYNTLRNEMIRSGAAENVAISDFPTTGAMSADGGFTWEGKNPQQELLVGMNACSHDFPKSNGFIFTTGRDFSRDIANDSTAVVINTLAAEMFWPGQTAVGKKVTFGGKTRQVVGVIKNQTRAGPYFKNIPHVYYINYSFFNYLTIRLNPDLSPHDALARAAEALKKFDPAAPFDYSFVDESYAKMFATEEQLGKLAIVFAIVSMSISCLGMLTLAAYAASRRVKEIGIRKVLGASVFSIWKLLSREFVLLVAISILIAAPMAWYASAQWLTQFDYRTEMPIWLYPTAALVALVSTLATISIQSVAAARSNPVSSLRSE